MGSPYAQIITIKPGYQLKGLYLKLCGFNGTSLCEHIHSHCDEFPLSC